MKSAFTWLMDGRYLLWVAYSSDKVIRAAFLTRTANYPCKKMLTVEVCGGIGMDGWLGEASRIFQAFSRESGLDGVELYGRPGWARALRQFGWTSSIVMAEVDNVHGG